jgi:hypothetical protein
MRGAAKARQHRCQRRCTVLLGHGMTQCRGVGMPGHDNAAIIVLFLVCIMRTFFITVMLFCTICFSGFAFMYFLCFATIVKFFGYEISDVVFGEVGFSTISYICFLRCLEQVLSFLFILCTNPFLLHISKIKFLCYI